MTSKHWLPAALVCLALSTLSCSQTAADSDGGVDTARLDGAFVAARQFSNLKCLVVSQNGKIVREEYFNDGGPDIPHDVRSVTKSVTGLLIGIAIDKGFIPGVDQRIGTYIDPLVEGLTEEKADITIGHLLTMSGGFTWNELASATEYNNWITAPNQVQYLMDRPLSSQPGRSFTYNSAALHLLSVVVSKAATMRTDEFARQHLFGPLGIGERAWQADRQGFNNGGTGLQLTPHDMVKIGQLMLDGGEANGRRIVSVQWVDEAMSSKIGTQASMGFSDGYGYCWWTGRTSKGAYAFANGYGGQFILVEPSRRLVVAATNKWSGVPSVTANDQWSATMDLLVNRVLPAMK